MNKQILFITMLILSLFFSFPKNANSQDTLSSSSTWFAKVLRNYYSTIITIHDINYYNTRIRCSNKDLTRFKAKAGKINIGLGPAFCIQGELTLDPLPSGLNVINGANGKKYMLFLQAYLFSPEGELLWNQKGYPKSNAWVDASGSNVNFYLINKYDGYLKGCTAIILASGDPILINGTSETRVILGMKRFNFKDESESSEYYSEKINESIQKDSIKNEQVLPSTSTKEQKFTNLQFIKKKSNGWTYTEVIGIPETIKKKIFYDVVEYQDKTGDDDGAYKVISERYDLPKKAVDAIAMEGTVKDWPMPSLK